MTDNRAKHELVRFPDGCAFKGGEGECARGQEVGGLGLQEGGCVIGLASQYQLVPNSRVTSIASNEYEHN
jgi:hypothetical protein